VLTKTGRLALATLALLALGGCSAWRATATPPDFYSLDSAGLAVSLPRPMPAQTVPPARLPTLIVNRPLAAAGFDSPRIIYLREPHKLDYFAHSEWVNPPARMLGSMLVTAISQRKAFGAVVLTPGAASGYLRLDTEIIRLQHEFLTHPSQVRFTLRVTLVNEKTRQVVAGRDFERVERAASNDPYGGVGAANRAVQGVLEALTVFCEDAAQDLSFSTSFHSRP
jgi:cholesterol transport system auxiliary component